MKPIYIDANKKSMKQAAEYFVNNFFSPAGLYSITHYTKTDNDSAFFYIENNLYEITHSYYSNEYRIEYIPENNE